MQTLLFILWVLFISGALMTTMMICKTDYNTKKYNVLLVLCPIFNILAIVTMIIRNVIS